MKIVLKSLNRHLVRFILKLKLIGNGKESTYSKVPDISLFQSTSHQPISVADLG